MAPHWLPELISVNGSWDEVRERLYAVFSEDFIHGSPRFQNLPVRHDTRRLDGDQFEEGTGEIRRYLWLTECDYLVVLAKRSKRGLDAEFFLITAFYLDGPSSRRRIQRKFEQRQP